MTVQNAQSSGADAGIGDENGQGSDSTSDTGSLAMVGDLGTVFEPQSDVVVSSSPPTQVPPVGNPEGNTSPFVINVTYDQSVGSLPSGFVSAINFVVNYYESLFVAPITVNIDVGYGEIAGQAMQAGALGESESYLGSYSYSTVKSALANVDPGAAATMPSSMPVSGTMWVSTAEAKALSLSPVQPTSSIDGYAGFSSVYPFTYNPNNRAVGGSYDFIGTVEHEFTEIMGRIDLFGATIGSTAGYSLLDMFHYTSPGVHTYSGRTTNYFSVNGGLTDLDYFNSAASGDLGDWAGSAGSDAYLAFSPSGQANTVSQTDITEMNALGYRLAPQTSITVAGSPGRAIQGGGAVTLLSGAPTIVDAASTTLSSATVKITNSSGNAVAGDQLLNNGLQNGPIGSGVTLSWNAGTSTMTLTGVATLATYDTLLGNMSYQDTGTDASSGSHPVRTITWSVTDGTNSFTTTSQVSIDRPPTANSDTASVVAGSTIATTAATGVLSNDTDLDGDSLTVVSETGTYETNVGRPVSGVYGHLTLNFNGSYSYAADISSAINGAATGSHLTDSFIYTESDGTDSTVEGTLTITLDRLPVVTAASVVINAGHAPVAASSLFTASDADGDAVAYGFMDTGNGNFVLNGVAQANNREFDITQAQLSQLTYQSVAGAIDTLQIRANDGTAWSSWTSFTVTTPLVIEASGTTSLVEAGNNYFLYPVGGSSGPTLRYGGAAYTTGELGAWAPIGVEATAGGYEVAWKMTGIDQYTVWNTDSNGNYLSNAIGVVSGSDVSLEMLEPGFSQDLNGDGTIGAPTTVVEAHGATSLVEVGNNYFLYPVGGSSGPTLRYGGAAYTTGELGAWAPIGVEATAGGYEVAWKMTGIDQYTVWNTDSNGNYLSNAIGVVSGSDASLEMLEPGFSQDLNGDGTIGAPTTVVEAHGATSLVEVGNNYFLYPVGGSSGPTLRYGGAAYTTGELGAWAPIGVEATAGGYEVAWKMTGIDQYTVWNTDSNGNYLSNAIGVVSGSDASLEMLEPGFSQDLNGDGTIGLATTVLDGHLGGQTLTAGGGPTALIGGPNDILNAGAGVDTFVFTPNSGSNTINGFASGMDAVQFDHTVFANIGAVLSQMQQVGSDVVITANPQNSVTLHDVTIASLNASDFRIL